MVGSWIEYLRQKCRSDHPTTASYITLCPLRHCERQTRPLPQGQSLDESSRSAIEDCSVPSNRVCPATKLRPLEAGVQLSALVAHVTSRTALAAMWKVCDVSDPLHAAWPPQLTDVEKVQSRDLLAALALGIFPLRSCNSR